MNYSLIRVIVISSSTCIKSTFSSLAKNNIAKKHLIESLALRSFVIVASNAFPLGSSFFKIRSCYSPIIFSRLLKYFLKSGGSTGSNFNWLDLRSLGFAIVPMRFSNKSNNSSKETGYVDSCL